MNHCQDCKAIRNNKNTSSYRICNEDNVMGVVTTDKKIISLCDEHFIMRVKIQRPPGSKIFKQRKIRLMRKK